MAKLKIDTYSQVYYTNDNIILQAPKGKWIPVTLRDCNTFKNRAVIAGYERNQVLIYLGRVMYDGDQLPCKIIPSKNEAYVSFGRKEIKILQFEFCCLPSSHIKWIPSSNGRVPNGAVEFGRTKNDEPLYTGRVHYNGSLIPGKIQPSHECIYIHPSYGFKELKFEEYEVLVYVDDH